MKKGKALATHVLVQRTSHYQLSKAFSDYKYYEQGVCWPELLTEMDEKALNSFWDAYRKSDYALIGILFFV